MGGVQYSTLYLAERLNRRTYNLCVICPAEGALPDLLRQRGIPVVIVPQPPLFGTSVGLFHRYWPNPLAWIANLFLLLFMTVRLANRLRQLKAQLVYTKGLAAHFYGGGAAWLAGLPCLWHVQDLVSRRAGGLYPLLMGLIGQWFARFVIVDGNPIAAQLAPYISAQRLVLIHNGVDLQVFSPQVDGRRVRLEWGIAVDEFLIGNVARFTPWKGQHWLIEAFAALSNSFPSAKLVLVGAPVFDSGAYEVELRALVDKYELQARVIFAGFRSDLPEVLAAMDVFVHTSVEKDTSPLAVVSAMAMGKAIISTAVPGVAELFPKQTEALLVPPSNPLALGAALQEILTSPSRRTALGQAARCQAEESLSLDYFTRQCEQVFERCLNA